MFDFDLCNRKWFLPLLLLVLAIGLVDLASSFGWPVPALTALHLAPLTDDTARGLAAGLGGTLSFLALFQAARIWARHSLATPRNDSDRPE